jgi:hypothetical protein
MHDNLHCYTALAGKDFDALIDSSETNRRRAISQREIILLSPPPTQCPDGLWRVGERSMTLGFASTRPPISKAAALT